VVVEKSVDISKAGNRGVAVGLHISEVRNIDNSFSGMTVRGIDLLAQLG
jgi:hypothetical protein